MGACASHEGDPLPVFGAELTRMDIADKSPEDVPLLVVETCKYIREKGSVQGIFRRSANAVKLATCKQMYNNGEKVNFDSLGGIHMATNALKAFFRDLRVPLLTNDAYTEILKLQESATNSPAKLESTKQLLLKYLPAMHLTILRTLLFFIGDLSEQSETTGMSLENLAIVFGPNLLWQKDAGPNSGKVPKLQEIGLIHGFVEYLIRNRSEVFEGMDKPGYHEVNL
eukprot:m.336285 g.336285  ORF g.336285 m.336285 type:complete len:226 (-) comp17804_c0_seq1:246-923(-)